MLSTLLLCSSLLAAAPDADRAAYEAARAKVGRDAEAHVKLALWCEAHGLNAERTKHLALAVLRDPQNAIARGLLGMVAFHGQWKRPEAVSEKVEADDVLMATMKEYQKRRTRAAETAEAQWKLGLWCEQNGLKAEATAHFAVVTRLDPSREAAWKRLGCKKFNGFWLTEKQIASAKEESETQKKADKHWKPILEKWRDGLAEKGKRRAAAVLALEDVTDPRAVPAIWAVFVKAGAAQQAVAVQLFGQIDAPSASQDLALLAVLSPSPDVRRKAAETLRMRDARDYAGLLVNLMRDPIKYEVRPVAGPGSQGVLFIKGKKAKVKRLYSPPSAPHLTPQPGDQFGVDANGLPVVSQLFVSTVPVFFRGSSPFLYPHPQLIGLQVTEMLERGGYGSAVSQSLGQTVSTNLQHPAEIRAPNMAGHKGENPVHEAFPYGQTEIPIGEMIAEAQLAALVAQRQLATDITTIERNNAPIVELNGRIRKILSTAAGTDLGEDRETWEKWYIDLLGFAVAPQMAAQEIPTQIEQVPLAYQPQAQPINIIEGADIAILPIHSCFGRGTLVKTLNGPRAIESIQRGDLVLTQDAQTGVLSFQPVLNSIHNPPNATLRIRLGDESIVVTGIHRFWKAGGGWVMARNLKVGDTLRTIGGTAEVAAIETDKVQPVFNLEVAQGQSFFVGNQGALVHDNSLVNAVPEPFDAAPDLATIASVPHH